MRKIYFGALVCLLSMGLVACNSTSENEPPEDGEVNVVDEETEEETEDLEEGIGHHDDLPFEWGGSYELQEGTYTLTFNENEHGDESIHIAFILEDSNISDLEHHAAHLMEEDADIEAIPDGEQFEALHEYSYKLALNSEGATTFTFTISQARSYRVFTEHHADEFKMQILDEEGKEIAVSNPVEYEGHDHSH